MIHIKVFSKIYSIFDVFQLVIANILQTRKQQVIIVSKETDYVLSLTNEQLDNGDEIEQLIVSDLVDKHLKFIWSKEVSWLAYYKL